MDGIGVSSGIAIGKALLKKPEKLEIEKKKIYNTEDEIIRLHSARSTSREEIEKLYQHVLANVGKEEAKIFEAHKTMIDDPMLFKDVEKKIRTESINAEWALWESADKFIRMFEGMKNKYVSERAADIRDITNRILRVLLGVQQFDISKLDEGTIIIAEDLLPSDTANMDKEKILGIVTEFGGKTSHSAIIARTLEIPAVVGVEGVMSRIANGDLIVFDGDEGRIFINPGEDTVHKYRIKKQEYESFVKSLREYKGIKSITRDGIKVEVMANIGTLKDLDAVHRNDAEGIGLFRTEFLYMDRDRLPTEEEQFQAYKEAAESMNNKPIIFRTLDIGGDKDLPYMELPKEMNPFLGYRAIRLCLDRKDIFRTQLRAVLRASAFGNIKMMFPMISNITELKLAKNALQEAEESLKKEGVKYNENMEIGIMIEVPSAAMISDMLADEVDFFSIGTNDLIQYMTAVDRGNPKISHLYSQFHPALLRVINQVVENGHKKGIWVGMCGEAAGDPRMIPVLIGMGMDEISMNPSLVLRARSIVNSLEKKKMEALVNTILNLSAAEEIESYINEYLKIQDK